MTRTDTDTDPVLQAAASKGWPHLPGGVLGAVYVALCLIPLILALGQNVSPADHWGLAAAALGMIALGAMALQFLTSGRFETVSGRLGIDKVMAFHKFAVWWIALAILLHPVVYVVPTWMEDAELGQERLIAYLTLPQYRTGVIAWGAVLLIVLSSPLRDRLPWTYEAWRASHIMLALIAVGGGLHHAASAGRFSATVPVFSVWLGFGAVVACAVAMLYGLRWYRLHQRPWRLAAITKLADRMWELDIKPAPGTPPLPYHAGQFVWMSEGARRFPLFDHPFSIADSPLRPGLSLIIKEAGDFTSQIGTLAPGTPIGIDGPHGEFTADGRDADALILIAGGVGIAPVMGILRDLVARRDARPVRLAYAVGKPANFACLPEIAAACGVLDLKAMLLSEEADSDSTNLAGDDLEHVTGRLDADRLRALLKGLDPARSVALMCGPGGMVTAASDALLDLGMPMRRVVYERFDYAGGASRQDRRRRLFFVGIGVALAMGLALFVPLAA